MYGHDQPTVPQGSPSGNTAWVPYDQPAVPTVDVAPAPPKGRKGKVAAAIVGAVAVLGAGTFAVTSIAGGGDGGGGDPEDAVEEFFGAVENLDVLGVMDTLLPGERDIMRERAERFVSGLSELGVLSDDADLGGIAGVEITFEDLEFEAVETNVDDITNVVVNGEAEAEVNGESLPIGDLVIDEFLDGEPLDFNEGGSGELDDFMLTTVEEDGRWYVSFGYTIAEYARTFGDPEGGSFDIPEADEAIARNGAETPEGAINNLIDSIEAFDLEGVIGTLDPREVGALQRYAPVFIDGAADAVASLEDSVAITFGDITYSVTTEGDQATIGLDIDALTVQTSELTLVYRTEGNCITITQAGGLPEELCTGTLLTDTTDLLDDLAAEFPDQPDFIDDVTSFIEESQAAFEDLAPVGITVSEVDGEWYVSLLGSGADGSLAVLEALDREEFESLIDGLAGIAEVAAELEGQVGAYPIDPSDLPFGD